MIIEFKEHEIQEALIQHLQTVFKMDTVVVSVDFVAGRKENGITATVEVLTKEEPVSLKKSVNSDTYNKEPEVQEEKESEPVKVNPLFKAKKLGATPFDKNKNIQAVTPKVQEEVVEESEEDEESEDEITTEIDNQQQEESEQEEEITEPVKKNPFNTQVKKPLFGKQS